MKAGRSFSAPRSTLATRRFRNRCESLAAEAAYDSSRESRVTSEQVSGTEGYADESEELFKCYESFSAADAHRTVLHLIPATPSRILDIGSGTGRDAAWFAASGHHVVAVEP